MSFEITLGINGSEPNRIGKTITTGATLSGTLKAGTTIINPVIIVDVGLIGIVKYNYMDIPTFGRKYFIKDIRSVTANLVEISGHVDVLESFSTEILAQTAIIERQENNWNLYLEDGVFKEYANPNIITKAFPSGFDTQSFVLAVAGGTD